MNHEPITDQRLQEIEDRLNAITPGQWEHITKTRHGTPLPNSLSFIRAPRLDPSHPYDIEVMGEDRNDQLYPPEQAFADGDFIAAAPTDVRDLIAEIRRLRIG